jgi:hypothetical protein
MATATPFPPPDTILQRIRLCREELAELKRLLRAARAAEKADQARHARLQAERVPHAR